ncbi:MAG: GAF domain-containing sensor histidine kinase [Chloroflexi bacterium]|nr:GAF domain-containing sensor histidine kinase [Chloroflexota bacterium]
MTDNVPPTTASLERKIDVLTRLAEVSTVLNSTLKLNMLLGTIMDTTADIVAAEAASVLLWDHNSRELRFAATTTDPSGQQLIGKLVPLEGSIAGMILRENRIIAVNDTLSPNGEPRYYHKVDEDTDFVTRSLIGVPMKSRNRLIGVLEAVNKRELPWTDDDRYYLSILASQAAVAIENAQLVAALRNANEELSQIDKLKSDFIAIASHELRTPLGVILGYASFLQDAQDTQVRGLASKVVNSALQLGSVIEDLTNLRYLEQKQVELQRTAVGLDVFLSEVIQDALSLAEAKGHRMVLASCPENVTLHIDRQRVGMALTNILNNAVRFTPDGGQIVLRAEQHGPSEVRIHVSDSGVGLSQSQMERIFDRFYQVEDHMTRVNGGLGIGLSIARGLIQAHGGRLWATSPGLGRGSTFTMALPLA